MVLPLAEARGGCAKPHCANRAAIHRHHRANEALWLAPFAHRRGEPKWEQFVARYYRFEEEDIVRLCANHHAEIHSLYDAIIKEDLEQTGLRLYLYSWKQAQILMQKLANTCAVWLLVETSGIDPDSYERTKKLRRSLLAKQAKPKSEGHKRLAKERGKKLRRKRRRRD